MRITQRSAADQPSVPGLRAGPLALFTASCVPMLVMLPAGLTGVLATVGVQADAGWVEWLSGPLGPVAQPLLIGATLLLAAGSLACGRSPVVAALTGGILLYLGMYLVTAPGGQTEPALFYPGLALFLASPALSVLRPRVKACRPALSAKIRRRGLAATLAASAILLAAALGFGWGTASPALHRAHAGLGAQAAAPTAAPSVRVEQDAFGWSGRVEGYTDEDAWFPPLSTDGAVLRIRGDVAAGSIYLQVMDGRAAIVYERTLDRIPSGAAETVLPGVRGIWMVTLGFRAYSGRLAVELLPLADGA